MVLTHLGYLMPASEERYDDGEIRHPNEIDSELITLGHTVNGAFAQALAACFDVLGNLDDDPALLGGTVRNPKSADYPWLPVRGGSTPLQSLLGVAKPTDVVEFRRPWGYPDRTNDPDPERAGQPDRDPAHRSAAPTPRTPRPTFCWASTGRPATSSG